MAVVLWRTTPEPEKIQNSRNSRPNPAMRSSTPQRRRASQTIAWCAAITLMPNSRSSRSSASAVGQCGDGNRIEVGVRVLAHELATHLERGAARDTSDLVEGAAPAGRAQHLAAEMGAITRDPLGLAQLVRLRHHHLLAAERLGGLGLRRGAGRDPDLQLGLELGDHLLRIGIALRQVDGNAAEHDDVHARRRHFARSPHADVVGPVDLILAAHHDRERGDDERHAGGNDLVELIGEDFSGERRRGIADTRSMPIDVLARRRRHCGCRCDRATSSPPKSPIEG